jgi:two-component system, chemotaxis family, chemotaxis protein CheY
MDQAVDDSDQPAIGQGLSVRRTVLVVHNDATIRSTLADALRDWGYIAREAATLPKALAIVSRERPAAVLLDIRMPNGSGLNILGELKSLSPDTAVIIVTGSEVRSILDEALAQNSRTQSDLQVSTQQYFSETKRGRPQHETTAPLGSLVLKAMRSLGLSYKHVVAESESLAKLHHNADMRIGKSTLGNIISGSIRQPGTAKLDALRIILNLSPAEIDGALGLHPEQRFAEELDLTRGRTHELSLETVTRQRKIRIPILHDDTKLEETQLLEGAVKRWTTIDVEYLGSFFPPHYCYVIVGEGDYNAAPIAPPGSRLLVNKLVNKIRPTDNLGYHERELYYLTTPRGFTCAYLETAPGDRIVLLPHPDSRNVPEEFRRSEITIIGQVIGVLYPR